MSDVFFRELDIPRPLIALGIGSGPHGQQTGRMLEGIERALLERRPDVVLVYGDTNSTLAGALAAVKLHIPVAHVEAGLRSFNRRMPEEINRIATDHLSWRLFAPTETAIEHLAREGISDERVVRVGDVMFDAARRFGARAEARSDALARNGLVPGDYLLATIHRAENTDDPLRLRAILQGLAASGRTVLLPLHPRTRVAIRNAGLELELEALRVIEPVGYLDMILLEKNAALIVTDSGGVQKEAFFFGIPCVTVREETEWTELVEAGWNRLVRPGDPQVLAAAIVAAWGSQGRQITPYGKGDAGERIAASLSSQLQSR